MAVRSPTRKAAPVPEWLEGWPVGWVYLFFAMGAFMRSQTTYWIGRGVTAGVLRSRWAERVDSPRTRRATASIRNPKASAGTASSRW